MIKINDEKILNLFWERSEAALDKTMEKYGRSLYRVARNILLSNHDAEECVNDTLLSAWEAIPPKRPEFLGAYLAKTVRNFSLKRWRAAGAAKRGSGQVALMLSELDDIFTPQTTDERLNYNHTVNAINACLRTLDTTAQTAFVRRYFVGDSIQEISRLLGASESKIKSMLFRARNKLKLHLEREGINI